MPSEALAFVIIIVVLGVITFVRAMNEPTDVYEKRQTFEHRYVPNYDYSQDRLATFAKMLSCSEAINVVTGDRIPFDVYVVKDGLYDPVVETRFKGGGKEEWMDIEFILDGYALSAVEPFKVYSSYSMNTGIFTNHKAVRSISDYEERKARGLKWTGREPKVESYERKVACNNNE